MNLLKKVKETLDEKKINYFQGNEENTNILHLPYRGIVNKHTHINIYMEILSSIDLIRFTWIAKSNSMADISELKSQLLDLNSSLNIGSLSMKNDSDSILYKADYVIESDFSFDTYNFYIVQCVKIYEKLRERDII